GRRAPALSRTRLASGTGESPVPRRLPLEHPERDIMKLLRTSDVAQALLPAVSRLVSTLVVVGRTPRSGCPLGQDAPVPPPEPRHQQADEGVGRGPGGPPHHQCSPCATHHSQPLRILLFLL